MSVKPIPEGYHSITPYLGIDKAAEAIEFYKRAFGATEVMRLDMPDGKIGHAELRIGDSAIMMASPCGEMSFGSPGKEHPSVC
ncbi:VOC family protein, partial [Salmonella enterica]|uniref:VOC family protein n=2 Tax=Gammaproteobacteria TaxID=1236 RepID=UPI0022B74091